MQTGRQDSSEIAAGGIGQPQKQIFSSPVMDDYCNLDTGKNEEPGCRRRRGRHRTRASRGRLILISRPAAASRAPSPHMAPPATTLSFFQFSVLTEKVCGDHATSVPCLSGTHDCTVEASVACTTRQHTLDRIYFATQYTHDFRSCMMI